VIIVQLIAINQRFSMISLVITTINRD